MFPRRLKKIFFLCISWTCKIKPKFCKLHVIKDKHSFINFSDYSFLQMSPDCSLPCVPYIIMYIKHYKSEICCYLRRSLGSWCCTWKDAIILWCKIQLFFFSISKWRYCFYLKYVTHILQLIQNNDFGFHYYIELFLFV